MAHEARARAVESPPGEARREVCSERPAADSDSRTGNDAEHLTGASAMDSQGNSDRDTETEAAAVDADDIFTGSYAKARDWLRNCPR
jgi:hypothetical protein